MDSLTPFVASAVAVAVVVVEDTEIYTDFDYVMPSSSFDTVAAASSYDIAAVVVADASSYDIVAVVAASPSAAVATSPTSAFLLVEARKRGRAVQTDYVDSPRSHRGLCCIRPYAAAAASSRSCLRTTCRALFCRTPQPDATAQKQISMLCHFIEQVSSESLWFGASSCCLASSQAPAPTHSLSMDA